MRFSTFHSFMLSDAKGQDRLLEGQAVGSTHHAALRDELALIRHADALGFHRCWIREHHFTDYGFLPNTMVLLAHAAAVTEQIRLGTAVVTLPLHHPVRAAEDVALVDVLSDGRVDVGIGRGYQSVEFDTFGVPLAEARSRTDEAIEIMTALWAGQAVRHAGPHWSFDEIRLQPRPLQRPHPPLYYVSVNTESIAHYAAKGIPFIVDSTVRTSRLAELADLWRGIARAHGHDRDGDGAGEPDLVAVRYVWVDRSDAAAREYVASTPPVTSTDTDDRLRPLLADGTVAPGYEYWDKGWHGRDLAYYDPAPDWEDRWLAGAPDRVIDQIRALHDLGIRDVCCVFGHDAFVRPRAEIERRMSLFAREVMPAFHAVALTGPTATGRRADGPTGSVERGRHLVEEGQQDVAPFGGEVDEHPVHAEVAVPRGSARAARRPGGRAASRSRSAAPRCARAPAHAVRSRSRSRAASPWRPWSSDPPVAPRGDPTEGRRLPAPPPISTGGCGAASLGHAQLGES